MGASTCLCLFSSWVVAGLLGGKCETGGLMCSSRLCQKPLAETVDGCRGIWESILLTFQILCFSQEIAALESCIWNLVAAAPLPEGGFPPGEVGMAQWWCALAMAAVCISSLQSFFFPSSWEGGSATPPVFGWRDVQIPASLCVVSKVLIERCWGRKGVLGSSWQ